MGAALRNKPFLWLCAVYLTVNLSFAFIKILMAYYIEYQLLMKAQTTLVMGLMLVCVTISLPFWQWLSRKMDKGPAYAIGMAVGALAILMTFFLPHGDTPLIYLVSVLAGFGFAANWIFPWAMVADVGDYDRLRDRPAAQRHVLRRLGTGNQDLRSAGAGRGRLDPDRLRLRGQRRADAAGPARASACSSDWSRRSVFSSPCHSCSSTRSPAGATPKCVPGWKPWTRPPGITKNLSGPCNSGGKL